MQNSMHFLVCLWGQTFNPFVILHRFRASSQGTWYYHKLCLVRDGDTTGEEHFHECLSCHLRENNPLWEFLQHFPGRPGRGIFDDSFSKTWRNGNTFSLMLSCVPRYKWDMRKVTSNLWLGDDKCNVSCPEWFPCLQRLLLSWACA